MSRKLALIVANTEYSDPGLTQLSAPGRDAEDFARVLKSTDIASFDDVRVLLNETEPVVREAIDEFFALKKPDDLLLLYFSGHGVRDEVGALYLAVRNTNRARLRSTAIKSDFIRETMDQSRSKRQVLILDCCNSGAFAQGAKAETGGSMGTATAFEGTGYGRVVLTASDSTQFAWEGDQVIGSDTGNSLFTHYLVTGLEGNADIDGDGRITVDELYDYAYEQIVMRTPKQTPGKWSYKQQGEIVLRQNIKPESIKPVSLPDDLMEEISDSRTYVREVAVQKLEKLLKGKNLGLARSAHEALEKMAAEDDSRRVSQAASRALEQAREADRIAVQKAEEERLAREQAERLAAQKAEEERIERERAEEERRTREELERRVREKVEAEWKALEEAKRLAAQKAEEEKLATQKAEAERKAKEDAERLLAEQKAEEEHIAKVKMEAERLAALKAQQALAASKEAEPRAVEKTANGIVKHEAAVKEQKLSTREQAKKSPQQKTNVIFIGLSVLIGVLVLGSIGYFQFQAALHASASATADIAIAETNAKANLTATEIAISNATAAAREATFKATNEAYATADEATAEASLTAYADQATQNAIVDLTSTVEALGFGPENGSLKHNADNGYVESLYANVDLKDFIVSATFLNPYSTATGTWDYGFMFRHEGYNKQYRLIITSGKQWELQNFGSEDSSFQNGQLSNLNTKEGGSNTIRLLCLGNKGALYVNGVFVADLDLSARMNSGDILITTAMKSGDEINGYSTDYEEFKVRKIPLAYGPENDSLNHNADDNAIEVTNTDVNLRDFIVSATFLNPYPTTTGTWDYGFLFRDEYSANQYRLYLTSGGSWVLMNNTGSGNGATIQSGQLSNLDIRENGSNTMWLLCLGDKGTLYVNGVFVADLDLSARMNSGSVRAGTGFITGDENNGHATGYKEFTVWEIP